MTRLSSCEVSGARKKDATKTTTSIPVYVFARSIQQVASVETNRAKIINSKCAFSASPKRVNNGPIKKNEAPQVVNKQTKKQFRKHRRQSVHVSKKQTGSLSEQFGFRKRGIEATPKASDSSQQVLG